MDARYMDQHVSGTHSRRQMDAETDPAWIDSRAVFAGRNEVLIRHGDQMYRLRITKLGKLILTK